MKNTDQWVPGRFIVINNKLRANPDKKEVKAGSLLATELIAKFYDLYSITHIKGKLLDLGCGKVPFYGFYKSMITDNICIDWENSLHKNPYLDFMQDLNKPMPFENDLFDTIILADVLEHIWNPKPLWFEMYRVLKYGGKLIMNVPFYYPLHEVPYDYYRYTSFALRKFAEEYGFNIIFLEAYGGAPEILADIFAKIIQRIPWIGTLLSRGIQKLMLFLLRINAVKKISRITSSVFPFGYFIIAEKAQPHK